MKKHIIIIGNGLAGSYLAEEIRKYDPHADQWEICVFGSEPYLPYNRILISSLLAGDCEQDALEIHSSQWWQENQITMYTSVSVTQVNIDDQYICTDQKQVYSYDFLIFATGSSPFIPQSVLINSPENTTQQYCKVMPFRTKEDCMTILSEIAQDTAENSDTSPLKITILGGGFVGIEAALALTNYALEINLIHPREIIMEKNLDIDGGKIFQRLVESKNISVHTARRIQSLMPNKQIELDDGSQIYTDILIIATGIRPNIHLAAQSGIACNIGIIVDNQLRTSSTNVFAIGECAEHNGMIYALVQPAFEQARILASVLHKQIGTFQGTSTILRLKSKDIEMLSLGETHVSLYDPAHEVIQFADPTHGSYCKIVLLDRIIIGAVIIGFPRLIPLITQLYDQGTRLSNNPSRIIFDESTLSIPAGKQADSVIICLCNSITKGQLNASWSENEGNFSTMIAATKASMGCGSCKGIVKELCEYWDSNN